MKKKSAAAKIVLAIYLLILHLAVIYLIYDKITGKKSTEISAAQPVSPIPTQIDIPPEPPIESSVTPLPAATTNISANNANLANAENFAVNNNPPTVETGKLLIPVVGVKKSELTDTFNDARSEGRVHNAIDIMAKGGMPVVAAADGEIAKFFDSKLGGITIYQYSVDKKTVYYYAHLQKRAGNLSEKDFVKQGTVIGFVGDTGNAGAGNFHLHFAISLLNDPKRYWEGTEINPFPILKNGIETASAN